MGTTVKQPCVNHEVCRNLCKTIIRGGHERPISSWCEECNTLSSRDRFYVIGWTGAWQLGTLQKDDLEAYQMGVNDRLGIANEE